MTPALPASEGFSYREHRLHCEDVALDTLAQRCGTPLYVYSRRAIEDAYAAYASALSGRSALVCYAVKANSNLAVLDVLARRGAGFDIVSGGELARVLTAGGDVQKIVFSGVGKSEVEIEAALNAGVACFNVESVPELDRIDAAARRLQKRARVALRVNPDIDAGTHPYISTGLKNNKFGVAYADALALCRTAMEKSAIELVGLGCHIGSQITEIAPYVAAADRIIDLVNQLEREKVAIRHIDFGGGLGIRYRDESPPAVADLISALLARLDARGQRDKTVIFEPGRSIVGSAGALLTRVEYLKPGESKNFAIVDAAMNDLIRPAMYDAWMNVLPVTPRREEPKRYDIVGPVCESADWLARDRDLALQPGDLLAIVSAGAYAMAMSSNYNSRARPAEVMVDAAAAHCVRRRETLAELFATESRVP
ncbi:MAG: diaminopimelate decarboxylase [Pseudomonadota bacterium]|nr:diaminopimelate decarboxylase [Burkholderiaceae bacterium]MDQ3445424.1 diaminopimelate decarboxylase [Pseudomonadota bacterium]